MQLLRKQSNTGTSTRLAKFTWAWCWRVCEIILLYTFVCLSVGHFFIQSLSLRKFVSNNCVGGLICLAKYRLCVFFTFVVVDLSPLMRKFRVYSTDLSRFTLYTLLHCVWFIFLTVYLSIYSEFNSRMYCSVDKWCSLPQADLIWCSQLYAACTLLVNSFKSTEVRIASYVCRAGGRVGRKVNGLSNLFSEFTNLLRKK